MRKILLIILALFIASIAYGQWEENVKTAVDLMPLDLGFYVSNNLVVFTPAALPSSNFAGRHTLTIYNAGTGSSIYIVTATTSVWSDGYEIPDNLSLSIDIGDSATDSVIYACTSESTISVSAHTIELR